MPPVPFGGATAARRAYATDEPLTKAGWQPLPAGFASRLSDPDCRIADLPADARLLVYRCPDGAGPGRSGSALLLPAGTGWEVVAVQSAIGSPGGIVSGIAVVPEDIIARKPRNSRAGRGVPLPTYTGSGRAMATGTADARISCYDMATVKPSGAQGSHRCGEPEAALTAGGNR